jgi:hypothetical protein
MTKKSKQLKTSSEDLWFVRKYCFANSYPASDVRCPYTKAKIVIKPAKTSSDNRKAEEVDGIFLCRYPNQKMPLHEARLISELEKCPNRERRKMIDALYKKGV